MDEVFGKCGHPKYGENLGWHYGYPRCLICHRRTGREAQARRRQRFREQHGSWNVDPNNT